MVTVTGTVIGIVGYYGFVRGYPLGPELMERLQAMPWPDGLEIREMNWGPVAIVQDFQAQQRKPARVVLVGALDRGLAQGTVSCRRWAGGVDIMFSSGTGGRKRANLSRSMTDRWAGFCCSRSEAWPGELRYSARGGDYCATPSGARKFRRLGVDNNFHPQRYCATAARRKTRPCVGEARV